ncbi:MAG: hypothetical protein C5B43_03870 [Verrucomicrobia bacterium]|nr:MAG: hypothetical protein C5B43_03870 [Verrucomicrobiota bacterium]
MQRKEFDFSDLGEQENSPKKEFDFSDLGEKSHSILPEKSPQDNESVIGQLTNFPKELPQFKPGTEENKDLIENMIGAASGAPGMNVLAKGMSSVAKGAFNVLNQKNPKDLAYSVQKAHDFLKSKAEDIYNFVKGEATPRGIGNIKIGEDLFKEIEDLPISKSPEFKDLISRAMNGDYEALRDLQSEIGSYGMSMKGSPLPSERYYGRSILNLRNRFNNDMYKQMEELGAGDLTNMLKEANKHYTKLHETYYKVPMIKKIVEEGKRIIPKNPIKSFSEESQRMESFAKEHPEIVEAVKKSLQAKKFIKNAKTVGKVAAYTAPGVGLPLYMAYKLLNLLKGEGE